MSEQEAQIGPSGISLIEQKARELGRNARNAAALSGNDDIAKSAEKAVKESRKDDAFIKETERDLDGILAKLQMRIDGSRERAQSEEGQLDGQDYVAETQSLFDKVDFATNELKNVRDQAIARLEDEERKVRKILDEHDQIARLLQGVGRMGGATDKQFDVMAFPKNVNAKTNVLQIAGGAGTGKTLCLLAKLIQDVQPSRQMGMVEERPKHGLFVCFNKALRKHIEELLAGISEAAGNIEVVHFDEFVNQLVRAWPKPEYDHLAGYASASRYPAPSINDRGGFWELIFQEDVYPHVAAAMKLVGERHADLKDKHYLYYRDPANVEWMYDEMVWLESRYGGLDKAREDYPIAERKGRGRSGFRPNADARAVILEVWEVTRQMLEQNRQYTVNQAVTRLLGDPDLPKYDSIAIDEVQDLTLASIRLLIRMRATEKSRAYICGDENQKIYMRDFTWGELDEGVYGRAISLDENKRNSFAIESFSKRLLGQEVSKEDASDMVFVGDWSEGSLMSLLRNIKDAHPDETTAIISVNAKRWADLAYDHGLKVSSPKRDGVMSPGVYVLGDLGGKGLEFHNVIVDCDNMRETDDETFRNILYVNCTRARKRLYVRYSGNPPAILQQYYPDFL